MKTISGHWVDGRKNGEMISEEEELTKITFKNGLHLPEPGLSWSVPDFPDVPLYDILHVL